MLNPECLHCCLLPKNRITFSMSGEIELGPLEEKYATIGADTFPMLVSLAFICTGGRLHCHNIISLMLEIKEPHKQKLFVFHLLFELSEVVLEFSGLIYV